MHRQRRFPLNIEKFSFWKTVPSCCFSKGKVICFFLSHFSPVFHFIWKPKRKTELRWVNVYILKTVATGKAGGHDPPISIFKPNKVQQFQFQTSGILLYVFSEIIRIRNFTIFTVYATTFRQFTLAFHFF